MFAIPPPTKSLSTFSVRFSRTFNFVEIFEPPIIPSLSPEFVLRDLFIIKTSFSKYRPEKDGRHFAIPTVET